MLMTISEIAVSRKTESLTSCHEPVISNNTCSNSVIASTTGANNKTPSDNMLRNVTPTKLIDDVYKTSNEAEASNQAHIQISYDKTDAINETWSEKFQSGYLHKFMKFAQLRRDDFASVINLSDYPLSVPQLRVLSRGLKFSPLPHSIDRL